MKKQHLVFALFGMLIVSSLTIPLYTQDTVTIKVTDKERIITGSGEDMSSKYLVFTETETFENTDVIVFGKFTSSDLQSKLRVDSTYNVRVSGFRIPFLSSYRNIVNIVK
jgi:hypothetical protein